jgi:HK97 family phage major capsid protein
MNIEQIIAECKAAQKRADGEVQRILDTTKLERRNSLTETESRRVDVLFEQLEGIKDKLARAEAIKADDDETDKLLSQRADTRPVTARKPAYDEVMRVTCEERQYNKGNDPNGTEFLRDVVLGTILGDPAANGRLARHEAEERIERSKEVRAAGDFTSGAAGGLVVPQYLVDLYAPAVANMRPLANVANHHTLPEQGMSLTIPRITQSTSAALQATELTGVSEQSVTESDLVIPVLTAAGAENVSRQAVERGTGIADLVMQDLMKRVATLIDSTLISQATHGLDAKAATVTYTSATPSGPEFWPYIFKAGSLLEQALLNVAPVDYAMCHPRRWNWLASQVSSQWPILGGSANDPQMMSQLTNAYGANVRGVLSNGLKVVVDANCPTNENAAGQDGFFVLASQELHLWEAPGAPVFIRAEQPNVASLGILIVAYSYFAYTAERYTTVAEKIIGTGMAAPAGF